MSTYQQFQTDLSGSLITSIQSHHKQSSNAESGADTEEVVLELINLIDALPYYGSPDWVSSHRAPLINLFEYFLPNSKIAPPPGQNGGGWHTYYEYDDAKGKYKGYNEVFYKGIQLTSLAAGIYQKILSGNPQFGVENWNKYAVALLTDGISRKVQVSVNHSKLTQEMALDNTLLMPSLSASVLEVFKSGYPPVTNALNTISAAQNNQAAAGLLNSAILAGEFTADINQVLAVGGDSAVAGIWFLFNLWITLTALGLSDVDGAIRSYMDAGLTVPQQVGPHNWWAGCYTSWYIPLSGADITGKNITASMPVIAVTSYTSCPYPTTSKEEWDHGYSLSLCDYGQLSYFK